jgi:maltose O-acetyltransferase
LLLTISRWPWPTTLRWALLRLAGVDIGRARIRADVFFGSSNISNGDGCSINRGCFLDGFEAIHIGNHVHIGMEAMIITSTHKIVPPVPAYGGRRSSKQPFGLPVHIGDGCWIGARAVILPGVTIGNGAIIGAAAIVARGVPAGQL